MKIILLQDVKKLGRKNDIINVKEGYARNLLFPKNLAKIADQKSISQIESTKAKQEENKANSLATAKANKEKIENQLINIKQKTGEGGTLFKAVSKEDIKNQINIPYKDIEFETPIKTIGEHTAKVVLVEGVEAKIKINIQPEE